MAELLTGHGCLGHGATFDDREHRRALVVPTGARRCLIVTLTGASTGAGRARAARGCGLDGNGAHAGVELVTSRSKFVERPLVLEEDDLAVTLAADLQPNADLRHRGVTHVLATLVDAASAVRTANDQTAFADRGKDRV